MNHMTEGIGCPVIPAPAKPAFKVGDRVECISGNEFMYIYTGNRGVIEKVDPRPDGMPYRIKWDNGATTWFTEERLKLLPPEPQMYICPKAGDCTDKGKKRHCEKHTLGDGCSIANCDGKVAGVCITYVPEAKAELPLNTDDGSKAGVYTLRPIVIMPDGQKVLTPMTRKQAMELGILNGKRKAKR